MRLREENEALMDSLVRTKVELAETEGIFMSNACLVALYSQPGFCSLDDNFTYLSNVSMHPLFCRIPPASANICQA